MKKRILSLLAISLTCTTLISCGNKSTQTNTGEVENKEDTTSVKNETKISFYNPIDSYFSTVTPTKKIETSLDSAQFAKDFQFAATMNNSPAKIDFAKENIGAIVLPETAFETTIEIQSSTVQNDTLHILYTIKQGVEEQTYTTVPVKLFAYNKNFNLVFDFQK